MQAMTSNRLRQRKHDVAVGSLTAARITGWRGNYCPNNGLERGGLGIEVPPGILSVADEVIE
jgi:hypothetical protein